MRPLKQNISITLDAPVIQKIKELADKEDRSVSQYINILLKQHIAETEKKH